MKRITKQLYDKKIISLFILICFLLLMGIVFALGLSHKTFSAILGAGLTFLVICLWNNNEIEICKDKKKKIMIIILICFFSRLLLLSLVKVTPTADYLTYFTFGDELKKGFYLDYNNLYIGLFNHVYGYSFFLSILFKLFGTHVLVGTFANVVLSTISCWFIYSIMNKIGNEKMAIHASLLWILSPSLGLWNSFLLSEPLYTTLLLAIFYFLIKIEEEEKLYNKIIIAILVALLLVFFNMVRPIGIILLTAILIWKFLVFMKKKKKLILLLFLLIVAVYIPTNKAANFITQKRVVTGLGGFSWYNVNVGLNEDSYGKWNEEDWNRVLDNVNRFAAEKELNPSKKAQEVEKELFQKRIKTIKHPIILGMNKINVFLGDDSTVVKHLMDSSSFKEDYSPILLVVICNSYYYMLILLSIIGTISLIKNKTITKYYDIIFIVLYALGLTCGHLLVEVQGRYHYSILVTLILVSSYTLSNIHINKEEKGEE